MVDISKLQPTRCNISWFFYFYRCCKFFRPGTCKTRRASVEIKKSRNVASCWL